MEGGLSYSDVQLRPAPREPDRRPPRPFDRDVARRTVAALDELPRPTLLTSRTGPRSSALVSLYAGSRSDAPAEEVLARAEADDAPFTHTNPLKARVVQGLADLT